MESTLHSFIDIFTDTFVLDGKDITLKEIVIPIIQRDYAQGRDNLEVVRVRNRFLDSLYKAITESPIILDFVYGDINSAGVMTPLDGQQRLTTLFLLHWYAAKKENVSNEDYRFLCNFSYETRYSARDFCKELVLFSPSFKSKISDEIINQAWFPLEWKKDSTISSMLVMIDAIDIKFKDVPNIWEKLKNNAIAFYFLPIRDMGLTDELYIKMNSRGKPLTQFEHFKAEFERILREIDESIAERILSKIDRDWTDLLWSYRNSGSSDDNIVDDEFLHYFKFICDCICYKVGESPLGKSSDEFELLQMYFSKENSAALKNIKFLEICFDCWCNLDNYKRASDFLDSVMSATHEYGKILVDTSRYNTDIFSDCLKYYFDKNRFPLNRFVLLYSVIFYLRERNQIAEGDFRRRIRIVNNLIQNSVDEVSDRSDRNRIPAILQQVEAIIMTGNIDDSIDNNFNVHQLNEEKEKIVFLAKNPEKEKDLFALEDHNMLKGQISILGLENLNLKNNFETLFSCSWDLIDCALMVKGNYSQRERNKWRYQVGSKSLQYAWNELFHRSSNSGFDNTKHILVSLLKSKNTFTNKILEEIISGFIKQCEQISEYPFAYYYVKYDEFRPGSYGKLSNNDMKNEPYLFSVMQTKSQWSSNTYNPYLKIADDENLSREEYGQYLVYDDRYIECTNKSYKISDNNDNLIEEIFINQNEVCIDTENRILKLQKYIKNMR